MKRIFLILAIALTVGGGVYFILNKKTIDKNSHPETTNSLIKLKSDLSRVTKTKFIKRGEILTPELQNIYNDILTFLEEKEPDNTEYRSQLLLTAVGKRYVLISQPSAGSSYDEVIDSQTGEMNSISNGANYASFYLPFEGGKDIALYIGDKDIYTYGLDQRSFLLAAGSKLLGTETYNSGKYDSPTVSPEQTHTADLVTISVFDSSQLVVNKETGITMYKKVRDVTVPLQ